MNDNSCNNKQVQLNAKFIPLGTNPEAEYAAAFDVNKINKYQTQPFFTCFSEQILHLMQTYPSESHQKNYFFYKRNKRLTNTASLYFEKRKYLFGTYSINT